MIFFQSAVWTANTDSIYPRPGRGGGPVRTYTAPVEALKLLARRGRYDVVLTMGARCSLAYGLLCALLGVVSRQVMCEVFIDRARPRNFLWRLKVFLYRVAARRSLGILANSSAEVKPLARRFGVEEERVLYVPMHTNIHEPHYEKSDGDFIFSAGRTWRDYGTLLRAAPMIRGRVVIICGKDDLADMRVPESVRVLREARRELYLDHLRRCALVVLPLLPVERATGQVVLLEAMALGKAVVASDVGGVRDHLRDGVNGLLVAPGDAAGLARAVNRLLEDRAEAERLGRQALKDVLDEYTIERHAERKLAAIGRLYERFARGA